MPTPPLFPLRKFIGISLTYPFLFTRVGVMDKQPREGERRGPRLTEWWGTLPVTALCVGPGPRTATAVWIGAGPSVSVRLFARDDGHSDLGSGTPSGDGRCVGVAGPVAVADATGSVHVLELAPAAAAGSEGMVVAAGHKRFAALRLGGGDISSATVAVEAVWTPPPRRDS